MKCFFWFGTFKFKRFSWFRVSLFIVFSSKFFVIEIKKSSVLFLGQIIIGFSFLIVFNYLASKTYRFSVKNCWFIFINFYKKCYMRQSRSTNFFESLILGSLHILWPGDFSRAKLYKIGWRTSLTIDPLLHSQYKWMLSIPVMLISFSVLYKPGIFWINPSISPKGLELDWVNPNLE